MRQKYFREKQGKLMTKTYIRQTRNVQDFEINFSVIFLSFIVFPDRNVPKGIQKAAKFCVSLLKKAKKDHFANFE